MVYMAGDNNLNTEMVYALEQIRNVALGNKKVDLYVYLDGASDEVPTLYCDFTKKKKDVGENDPGELIQSYKVKNKLIKTQKSFNENSAAISNIINFVDWCVKKDSEEEREKKKYAFIFSGHSFGFLNWGLYRDEKSSYSMTHAKLRYMFERITNTKAELEEIADKEEAKFEEKHNRKWNPQYRKERTEVVLGKNIEILGFDSCVMSSIEIACQFSRVANTMVASEGSIPTAGWNYTQILLGKISREPNTPANDIAVSFVEEFIKQQNKFALADISVDISAWNLEKLKYLESELKNLAQSLLDCFTDKDSVVYNQMRRLLVYVHCHCQTFMLEQQIDLGDFCSILSKEIDSMEKELKDQDIEPIKKVRESCLEIIKKIKECILLTGFSGTDFQFASGVSVFFPWSLSSYNSAKEDYEKLIFISGNSVGKTWNEFLQKYLGEVTFRQSATITEKDESGNVVSSSVVYRSYEAIDDDIENPAGDGSIASDDHRQPPNSGRQPPNSGKQPPNSGRMLSDMNYFLSRFIRLKNFQTGWNKAGFTSNSVEFKNEIRLPEGIPDRQRTTAETRPIVLIPTPRIIEKNIDELFKKLLSLKEDKFNGTDIDEYIAQLRDLVEKAGESEITKILKDVSKSDFLTSVDFTEEKLGNMLSDSYRNSLDLLTDKVLKADLTKSFEKSSLNKTGK